MSHELTLLARTPEERAAFEAALVSDPRWARTPNGLVYENHDTGVYATVEGLDDSAPAGRDGVVASINYARPSFFALEVMPQLVAAAQAADILVIDPQDDLVGGSRAAKSANADELITSWEAGDRATSAAASRAGADIGTMPRDRAVAWWRYMREKASLTERYGKTHYVPGLRLVRRSAARDVLRVLTWTDWIPLIVPDADIVAVIRSQGGTFEIRGYLPFTSVSDTIGGLLRPLAVSDELEVRILDPSEAVVVPELFAEAALEPFTGFAAVAPDGFIDDDVAGA